MSPPFTSTHCADSPDICTDSRRRSAYSTVAWLSSRLVTNRTDVSSAMRSASASLMVGLRRQGLLSSDPSDTLTPARKNRHTRTVRRATDPEGHARTRADGGECRGFDEELAKDVAPPGAERFPNADLARSLGNGHQHDVHDHDATDHQRDRHESWQGNEQDLADLAPEIEHFVGGLHRKVVFIARAQVPAAAHDRLRLLHRLAHLADRARLDGEGVYDPWRIDVALERRGGGRHGEFIERETEQVALLLDDADYAIGDVVYLDLASDRFLAIEEFVRELVTEYEDRKAGLYFLGREPPAVLDRQGANLEVEIGGGSDLHVLDRAAARKQRGPGRGLPRGEHRHREAADDRLRVIVGDAGATHPRAPHRIGDVADLHVRKLPEPERVHAEQRARELVGHVAIHPLDDRHDRDEEHDADEDADAQ